MKKYERRWSAVANKYLKAFREVVSDIKAYHPLQESYEQVLRGEKTWNEYGMEFWKAVKEGDEDGQLLGIAHVHDAIARKSPAAKERGFWKVASRAVDILETDPISTEIRKSIHKNAVDLARHEKIVLRYPEFWQTLLSTAVLEDMDSEGLQRIEESIRLIDHVLGEEKVRKHALEYSRTIMELAEELLKRKGVPRSRRRALAGTSAMAAIRVKTLARLMARGQK